MDHDFERWVGLHGLIESAGLGYVLDNHVAELCFRNILVIVEDCLAFLRCAHGCDDGMASFKQNIEYVSGYKARTTCNWH